MLASMAKNTVKAYPLRLPEPLREKLEQATVKSGRTLRAEILERLESTFADPADTDLADQVGELRQQLAQIEHRLATLEQAMTDKR